MTFRQNYRPLQQPASLRALITTWVLGTVVSCLLFVLFHLASATEERDRIAEAMAQRSANLEQQAQARKELAGHAICRDYHHGAKPFWDSYNTLSCITVAMKGQQ